jgi:thiol-disulfide isomerase/thioredoxin
MLIAYIWIAVLWQPLQGLQWMAYNRQINRYYETFGDVPSSFSDRDVGGSRMMNSMDSVRTHTRQQRFPTALHMSTEESSSNSSIVKLPILQLFKRNELVGEFICGNDLATSIDRFKATLPTLEPKGTPSSEGTSLQTVYSDDQLERSMSSTEFPVILKLYRDGCKKCAKLEPVYEELSRAPEYSNFIWLQAEVSNVAIHTKKLKERLLGLKPTSFDEAVKMIEDCVTCNSTGFVGCPECQGVGYIQKGEVAVFCPTCVGYKKIRCGTCGGKCLKCSADNAELTFSADMD